MIENGTRGACKADGRVDPAACGMPADKCRNAGKAEGSIASQRNYKPQASAGDKKDKGGANYGPHMATKAGKAGQDRLGKKVAEHFDLHER